MKDLKDIERVVRGLVDVVFGILRLVRRSQKRRHSDSSEGPGERLVDMQGRQGALWGAPSLERRMKEGRR